MATSLKQGEALRLARTEHDLSRFHVCLGWNREGRLPAEIPEMHVGAKPQSTAFDLDVVAILLNQQGKIADLGNHETVHGVRTSGDVVYHRVRRHSSGAIWLSGDNRSGDGDEEQIVVDLAALDAAYQRIVFLVIINEAHQRRQNFAQVGHAYIRVLDSQERSLCRYDLSDSPALAHSCALTFAELRRDGADWQFCAIGQPHEADRFSELLKPYL
ncbi:TerD family protein [Massilia sp. W12]|uniref:TerD family protein n=1 Tax=Massilia sp. W12 TaxID=3126507 RepID=UPI0030D365A7